MTAEIAQLPEVPTANIDVSLQISLSQMLDLALGSPEIGAVNFNILHHFLHVLLNQTNLQTTKIEYRGENADRIKRIITSFKPETPLYDYSITDDEADVGVLTEVPKDIKPQIEKVNEVETVIFDKPVVEELPAYKQLEQSLEQQYQTLQDVTSAIDTSLINTRLDKLEDKVSKMEQKLKNLQTITAVLIEDIPPTTDVKEEKEEVKEEKIAEEEKEEADATIEAAVEGAVTNDVIVPYYEKDEIPKAIDKITDKIRRISPETLVSRVAHLNDIDITEIHQDVATLKQDVIQIKQELQNLNERVEQREIPTIAPLIQEEKPVVERELIKEQIVEVCAANLEQCLEAVRNVETTHGNALRDVTQRVIALEKEIGHLLERMDRLQKVDKKDDIDINELVTNMQRIETDMEKIEQAMGSILDDKETKDAHIKTLLEQIELLKTIKANKEDLKDALADKADTQTMNKKVSRDQFNAACDDLARGLEEAINKLTKQESIWQQALDNVQNEIATKMDKAEMTPLMDFVHKKLKSLQEKLKIIVEARREIEAAGTKKMLRDVQCISCDKDVVMKREEVIKYRVGPLPCTISMKPYLTYELDQVRRQQKRLPYSRNMIQFEAATQEKVKKMKMKEELLAKTPPGAHLCNRYCGGSHTVTTPQQRVLRTGHFLTQWGPEMIQLTDGLIRGKDGQMYRSRLLSDVCGPTCWESQTSEETRSSERSSSAPTPLRKSPPSRRNSAGNQKKELKDLKTSEEKTIRYTHFIINNIKNIS
ncbi:hypothetical protein P5V15_011990 [Pogonomyrmex californicus]